MTTPATVDAYLAALPEPQRTVMEQLRETIRAAAPEATELVSYDMPAFKTDGRFLVSYAAFKGHFSLFPASAAVVTAIGPDLSPYLSGKATIRFTVADPLSMELVRRIVEIRLAENAADAARRQRR